MNRNLIRNLVLSLGASLTAACAGASAAPAVRAPVAAAPAVAVRADPAFDAAAVERALAGAARGSDRDAGVAQRAILGQVRRIDREQGGVFAGASSAYVKDTASMAEIMRLASIGYGQFGTKKMRELASVIRAYLETRMMSADGVFFAGEEIGSKIDPRIDTRTNAIVIRALATYYAMTKDPSAIAAAERAMNWLVEHRQVADGAFIAGEGEAASADSSSAVGQAMLALFEATRDQRWQKSAERVARYTSGAAFEHMQEATHLVASR